MKKTKRFVLSALMMLVGTFTSVFAAPDPNFHIYLCFGQSNMEGQGEIESQDKTVDSRFQVLCSYSNCGSRSLGKWYDATPPLSCCSGSHLGPVDYFGRTMVKNLPENIKVGVAVVAIAGCDIQLFEKDNYKSYNAESYMQSTIQSYGGNPYGRLVEMGKEAQKVGVIKGILLHQGETNSGQSNWPSRVKGVYNNLLTDLGLKSEDVPLLVGEVVTSAQGGMCGGMNSIIDGVPNTIPNSYVISAQGLGHKGDNLHFSSASYRTLGERYATQMLKVLKLDSSSSSSSNEEQDDPGTSTTTAFDPCSVTTSMSGGQTASNGGTHDISGGFNYEMWTNSGNNASMKYTSKEGQFQFQANWNNPDDLLCRIGLYWGGGTTPKPTELKGDLHCDFNYTCSGTGGGYNYIGIYGWTKTPNEVEYYIVENTFFGSTAKQQGLYYGASSKGTYTMDGETYELWVGTRTNAPSISGTSTFTQVFAVRKSIRKCGHISVSAHMREWAKKGVTLGQLYDCKFLCEVGSGSGSFDLKYGNIWIGEASSSVTPQTQPTVEQKPYKDVIEIPGVLEAENYDIGGNGNAYYDTDDVNEGDAKLRTDEGVDIVKAGNGYGIGYTTTDEWLEYTVNVKETATYDLVALASNGNTDPKFTLYLDDSKLGSLSGSQTADWDTYEEIKGSMKLTSGKHVLKIAIAANYCNLDKITFYKQGEAPEPEPIIGGGGGSSSGSGGGSGYNEPGVYPLSYSVENTGAECDEPSSLNKNNLKSCKTLPNPFEWADGSGTVSDFCDWSCRRNEIKREIEYWEIGEKPKFDKLEATYSNGTLTVKVYNGSNTLTLTSKLSVPSGSGPHPIVIGMDGNTGSLSSSYFSKCIQVPFTHSQIAEYNSGFGGSGRSQSDPFYKLYPGTFNTKADYCAWSWGISRLIDGLEIVKDKINADLGHIAVTGCSYAGKMALYAGAFDERVALTIAQESGGGGINAWRVSSEIGSDVEGISNTNYDWFLSSFKTNFQSSIDKLPYDHHELIAMIAPRAFLAFGNPDYTWLGDAAGVASLKAAEEVWKSMGIEDRFGYVVEGGHSHCQASSNQNSAAQKFINKFLYGDNSQNTKIRTSTVSSNQSSGKFTWSTPKMVNNGCGTAVQEVKADRFSLSQNMPNPTHGETSISFTLSDNAFVAIDLYNSLGVKVKTLVADEFESGAHILSFNVGDLPKGIYHYVMSADGFVDSKSMIVK